jgi:type ISP restriction-modification system protein
VRGVVRTGATTAAHHGGGVAGIDREDLAARRHRAPVDDHRRIHSERRGVDRRAQALAHRRPAQLGVRLVDERPGAGGIGRRPPARLRRAVQGDHASHDPRVMRHTYLYRPLDRRQIWYDTKRRVFIEGKKRWAGCLVQRYGEEFKEAISYENEFFVTVPQPRRVSETRPALLRSLVDLHFHDRGSVCFPAESVQGSLFAQRKANLQPTAWEHLRDAWGLDHKRPDQDARSTARQLLRNALAIMHAPKYEEEHAEALAHDWAHFPIPKDLALFRQLANAGETVATLLDPCANPDQVAEQILEKKRLRNLGVQSVSTGSAIQEKDLVITIAYFGGGRGGWRPRAFRDAEAPVSAWGSQTGDLYISDDVFFGNIPHAVWSYELGGYPVLKKWLGYRESRRRDGRPLTLQEAREFRAMIWRLAALIAFHEELDRLYELAAASAFTAEDLGLEG